MTYNAVRSARVVPIGISLSRHPRMKRSPLDLSSLKKPDKRRDVRFTDQLLDTETLREAYPPKFQRRLADLSQVSSVAFEGVDCQLYR